jgi:ABC-type transport system involved in cytochrome c biogenesis permease subunit
MKRFLPWIICLLCALWAISKMMPARQNPGFNIDGFGQLPVLVGGRVMPMDTLARVSLSAMNHHGTYDSGDGRKLTGSQSQWLLETFAMPEHADLAKVFEVKALPGVLSLVGSSEAAGGFLHYSFQDLKPFFFKIEEQAGLASQTDAESRDEFQREIIKLREGLRRYIQLKNTLQPEDSPDFGKEIQAFEQAIRPGMEAIRDRDANRPFNQQDFERIILFTDRYQQLSQVRFAYAFPAVSGSLPRNLDPEHGITNDRWQHISGALLSAIATGKLPYPVTAYGKLISAYRGGDTSAFNQGLQEYQQYLQKTLPEELSRPRLEFLFNHAQPFYQAILLYGLVFLFALLSWLVWPNVLGRAAVILLLFTFLLHTAGLVTRMYLQGRPPVTNLYSSAIFVGWSAVLFCLFLERLYKNGVGSVCGSAIGFLTLLIAQNLQWDGDSLEMLRAVLDTNIWLATHVVVVTLGYSATFLSGFLGIVYIARGLLTKSFDQETSKSLARMIYGVVCFATLFSFTGTILGGIWADQSWGRFWGWDPKENGALLIVLWNAIILHARWGGYARERGVAALAVFGNIVTSLSWFGVNMLGVGLHSYGFMDRAFGPLMLFIISQLLIVAAAMIPLKYWRGIRAREEKAPVTVDADLLYNR